MACGLQFEDYVRKHLFKKITTNTFIQNFIRFKYAVEVWHLLAEPRELQQLWHRASSSRTCRISQRSLQSDYTQWAVDPTLLIWDIFKLEIEWGNRDTLFGELGIFSCVQKKIILSVWHPWLSTLYETGARLRTLHLLTHTQSKWPLEGGKGNVSLERLTKCPGALLGNDRTGLQIQEIWLWNLCR